MATTTLTTKVRWELETVITDAALESRKAYRGEFQTPPFEDETGDWDSEAWAEDYKSVLYDAGIDDAISQDDHDHLRKLWLGAFFLKPVYETDDLTVQADAQGTLYMSNNAVTDERITSWMYSTCVPGDVEKMGDELIAEGMPREIAEKFVRQALGADD